jgi:hypothetical protein
MLASGLPRGSRCVVPIDGRVVGGESDGGFVAFVEKRGCSRGFSHAVLHLRVRCMSGRRGS